MLKSPRQIPPKVGGAAQEGDDTVDSNLTAAEELDPDQTPVSAGL